jgi:hypothetical protein
VTDNAAASAPAAATTTTATTAATTTAAAAGGANGSHWADALGLNPDQLGFVKSKGLKGIPETVDSLIGAERAIGADKIALPPKDKDGKRDFSKWDGFEALGRPKTAKDYDLKAVKMPDGITLDAFDKDALGKFLERAHAAGASQAVVADALGFYGEYAAGLLAAQAAMTEERAAKAHDALTQKWGPAFAKRYDLAQRAIRAFGGAPLLQAFKNAGVLDRDGALLDADFGDFLAQVGAKLTGDTQEPGGKGDAFGVMTPAQAEAEHKKMLAETHQAQLAGQSHPGWDRNHPEFQLYQEKASRLLRLAYPEQTAEGGAKPAAAA